MYLIFLNVWSERFKIISVYVNKAISSDRRYLQQIATAAFNLRTWDSDTRIVRQRQKAKELYAT